MRTSARGESTSIREAPLPARQLRPDVLRFEPTSASSDTHRLTPSSPAVPPRERLRIALPRQGFGTRYVRRPSTVVARKGSPTIRPHAPIRSRSDPSQTAAPTRVRPASVSPRPTPLVRGPVRPSNQALPPSLRLGSASKILAIVRSTDAAQAGLRRRPRACVGIKAHGRMNTMDPNRVATTFERPIVVDVSLR
jgi:hypothetical protein